MNIRRFFLQILPRYAVGRMVIYAKLMRVDKPIGTLLLLWPTYWALWIASKGVPDADIFIAFTAGTFLMRSAGCVVNDFADRNFDGAVERTKNRPFAKGLVSKTEALLLTVMLCLMAALCLVPLNRFTWLMSLPALFLAITYPFTKRFFPVAAVLFRTGIFVRHSHGLCRRTRPSASRSVADVYRQCLMDAGLRHDLCHGGQRRRFENRH